MLVDQLNRLAIARYGLRLRAQAEASLPPFLGSTLRGAFGHALKNAVCVMSHRDCERCLVADRCFYPYLFETPVPPDLPELRGQQQAPHPFILAPPIPKSLTQRQKVAAGEEITFGLTLMGRAVEMLPYVIYAVSEMARGGLGVDRARFELSEVAEIESDGSATTIYSGQSQRITVCNTAGQNLGQLVRTRLDQLPPQDRLRLRFITPTRIRVAGDLQVGLSFELLVRNLLRRVSMLAAVHGEQALELDYRAIVGRAAEVRTSATALRWWDWERYSNRQQTKMKLGGFVGEIEYAGEMVNEFLPLIAAGEILHVGNGTSFGLGRYRIAE